MTSPIFLIVIFTSFACGSNVEFKNNCDKPVSLIKTVNEQPSVEECKLEPKASCSKTYEKDGMNFKDGNEGKTLAEFTFNGWKNLDFYDLSVIVGYDTPMQIAPSSGGPTVTCKADKCPDAYLFPDDNSKNHGVPTGQSFTVTICP